MLNVPGWADPGKMRDSHEESGNQKPMQAFFRGKGDSGPDSGKVAACLLCIFAKIERSIFLAEKLKIIPLGGLDEIGKNITVLEYGKDMIVVDCGVGFPEEDM